MIDIAALVLGALKSGVVSGLVTNVASSQLVDPVTRRLASAFGDRIAGRDGKFPSNHHVELAVRTAQLNALRAVLAGAGAEARAQNRPSDLQFVRQANGWVHDAFLRIDHDVRTDKAALVAAIDAQFLGEDSGRAADMQAAAEAATLIELERDLGPPPERFLARFRRGHGDDDPSWFNAFGQYLAKQIKKNAEFRSILTAARLGEINDRVGRIDETLAGLEPLWLRLDERTQVLDRIEDNFALLHGRFDQLFEMLAAGPAERALLETRLTMQLPDNPKVAAAAVAQVDAAGLDGGLEAVIARLAGAVADAEAAARRLEQPAAGLGRLLAEMDGRQGRRFALLATVVVAALLVLGGMYATGEGSRAKPETERAAILSQIVGTWGEPGCEVAYTYSVEGDQLVLTGPGWRSAGQIMKVSEEGVFTSHIDQDGDSHDDEGRTIQTRVEDAGGSRRRLTILKMGHDAKSVKTVWWPCPANAGGSAR